MLAKVNNQSFLMGMLAIGTLVVMGSAFLMLQGRSNQEVLSATTDLEVSDELTGRPALTIEDVSPGDSVLLSTVELMEPGFVVIQQDQNREAGEVLGISSLLQAGVQRGLQVGVSTSLSDSQVIHIVMYKDNGDGVFGAEDQPVSDENNVTIEVVKNVGMLPMDHSF